MTARLTTDPASAQVLDPLRLPLTGARLIEASAGTGKTYTIAALYVRLVLGHVGESDELASNDGQGPRIELAEPADQPSISRPLTPPEILVVTFTEAATEELRDRIRARLAEAARVFLAAPGVDEDPDDVLIRLRADYPPDTWIGHARQLQRAASWMDESAVSTIHGWCHRMLREHAFDTYSLFTQTLQTDVLELQQQVVRDYWRVFMYPLDDAQALRVQGLWESPDQLFGAVKGLLALRRHLPAGSAPGEAFAQADEQRVLRLAQLKAPWLAWVAQLRQLIEDAVRLKRVKRGFRAGTYYGWLDRLRSWAEDPLADTPELSEKAYERLSRADLALHWVDGPPPTHPALEALAALPAELARLPDGREAVLCHSVNWVQRRFDHEQQLRAQMGFDDLLTELDRALSGPNGAALAERIRRQFPVAMIDEFQDTDPIQYRIFDSIYRIRDPEPGTGVILIGDPKQAIYAFRGADIYTYLAARRATTGRHYSLATNFRSTHPMVAAVNHCFERAEARPDSRGAFLFREGGDNPVPFVPNDSNGRKQRWWVDGQDAAALTCWVGGDGMPWSRTQYVEAFAEICAEQIVTLLRLGGEGRAGFAPLASTPMQDLPGVPPAGLQAVRPGDIAVLVNDRREAALIRAALGRRTVRSVYLSDKGSVFGSPVALELRRLLAACAEPDDDRLLRAALAGSLTGLDWRALDALNDDELAWERRVLQFREYRRLWQRQGVLPMMRRLLADFEVPRRLLSAGDERRLTDLLHMTELLQQASTTLDGEHALLRYLAEQQQDVEGETDNRRLRLESDEHLVKVVTIHKSKGLEYPLVFVPFVCAYRETKPTDVPMVWHEADGGLRVELSGGAAGAARVDHERLGEDLRKLYVAMTRARFAVWLGIASIAKHARSAVAYLLLGESAGTAAELWDRMLAFKGHNAEVAVTRPPTPTGTTWTGEDDVLDLAPERVLRRVPSPRWWVASFSALRLEGALPPDDDDPVPETALQETYSEDLLAGRLDTDRLESLELPALTGPAAGPVVTLAANDLNGLHDFPRGPEPGSFLHSLLEWAGQQGFARLTEQPELLRAFVERRCQLRGWARWAPTLVDWLEHWLRTPLRWVSPDSGPTVATSVGEAVSVRPADLRRYQVELEFWFEIFSTDARRLDQLVTRHTLEQRARPAVQADRLSGMLKGFIDLVFEHDGRYYVADYKSNWLGPTAAAYETGAMRRAVLEHRYDLQYALYVFALHRLLRSRLPDYDYDRHVGGAVYVFIRGAGSPSQGLFVDRPARALIDALDRLFSDSRAAQAS